MSTYQVGLIYTDMKNNLQAITPFYQEAAISGVPLPDNIDINVRSWHAADKLTPLNVCFVREADVSSF